MPLSEEKFALLMELFYRNKKNANSSHYRTIDDWKLLRSRPQITVALIKMAEGFGDCRVGSAPQREPSLISKCSLLRKGAVCEKT
ncbi:hypothetical protein TNCT_565351 [Trichonephila clavata]|uniref:Uncharacterized protein n=1 Tax=Trichonephila clavata TaxID=2740835 RepID=A0A8X6KDE3_TRICU|nr:hypothetical protein TNCT_565351 [Trichonephila clavata]